MDPVVIRSATISNDKLFRPRLFRQWDTRKAVLGVVLLNASTADERKDDPTVRKIMWLAATWGYGGFDLGNMSAYRATDPKDLFSAARKGIDIYSGGDNYNAIHMVVAGRTVLCGWGAKVAHMDYGHVHRMQWIIERNAGRLVCLGTTHNGFPKHPLYIAKNAQPVDYHFNHPPQRQ